MLGFARDGFPIFGPPESTTKLDECNGHYVNGSYRYHIRRLEDVNMSADYCRAVGHHANRWNWFLGCYKGTLQTFARAHRLTAKGSA